MSKHTKCAVMAVSLIFAANAAMAAEDARLKKVEDYVVANIKPWLGDPKVVDAVKAQNVADSKLKSADIDKMDIGWLERTDKKLIDSRMNNDLSTFLRKKKETLGNVVLEIFAFDNKGLNVGQTDLTEDYNQGDEAKYWKTYGIGPDAIFVDKIGPDGGKPNISQASLTIKDPASGQAIGAVTVGIDVDQMK
jgi:hypothetical protein